MKKLYLIYEYNIGYIEITEYNNMTENEILLSEDVNTLKFHYVSDTPVLENISFKITRNFSCDNLGRCFCGNFNLKIINCEIYDE